MRILVLGATGGIGGHLLQLATDRSHAVTVFVRSPEKIIYKHEHLNVIPGDPLNVHQLTQVLPGHDAVLSAFGPTTLRHSTLRATFAEALTAAMQQSGVTRGLVVSSALLFEEQNILGVLLRETIFRNVARDMKAMEAAIHKTQLDWTLVRPPRLTNGALTPHYRVADGEMPKGGLTISRASVADFMIKEAEQPSHLRKIVGVCN